METSYKGFEINKSSVDQRFRVYEDGEAFVPVFNKDGYATLNNAKGAITKHLKAIGIDPTGDFTGTEDRIAELVEQVRDSGMTILVPTLPITQSRNKREGRYAGKQATYVETRTGTIVRKPVKQWRAGPSCLFDDLRSTSRFMACINL